MINFSKLQIYIILIMSVFFQSYLNMYDTYVEYKDRNAYYNQPDSLKQSNSSSSGNFLITTDKHKENFYIPRQAQYVRQFLKKSPIDSFRLSPSIKGEFNRYAILEGAYPIQVSDESHYLITTSTDNLPKGCNILDSKEGIQIVYCP
jgi:hypothetical protein